MFRRQAEKIWSEAELAALVDHLGTNPQDGDVIPGTGGIRKLRWGKAGTGKRGGVRVIYFYHNADMPSTCCSLMPRRRQPTSPKTRSAP
jgi:hypothetical protein